LKIRNAAIHYYFPSRTGLGISVVDRELEKIYLSRAEWFTLPAVQQLRKVVETFYGSGRLLKDIKSRS
jgi:TetR/AcrR family transcriptional repressor of nem operon